MPRKGENIYKRKDGRWEGRYIKSRTPAGKANYGYVYLNPAEDYNRRQQKGKNGEEMLLINLRLLHLRPPHRTVRRQCPASALRSCSPRNTRRGTA